MFLKRLINSRKRKEEELLMIAFLNQIIIAKMPILLMIGLIVEAIVFTIKLIKEGTWKD